MDEQKWLEHYRQCDRSKPWVKMLTSDGKHWFFMGYDSWYDIKNHCKDNSVFLEEIHLQFRSNRAIMNIDKKADGIYFVRSVLGTIGRPTQMYYTFGNVYGNRIEKQMWKLPELILDKEYEESVENSFEEAILYETSKVRKK